MFNHSAKLWWSGTTSGKIYIGGVEELAGGSVAAIPILDGSQRLHGKETQLQTGPVGIVIHQVQFHTATSSQNIKPDALSRQFESHDVFQSKSSILHSNFVVRMMTRDVERQV